VAGFPLTAALYAEVRADAERHARARNAFFEQSQAAFRAGDGRLAKELGQKVWLLLFWLACMLQRVDASARRRHVIEVVLLK
jgi:hypothetical protein